MPGWLALVDCDIALARYPAAHESPSLLPPRQPFFVVVVVVPTPFIQPPSASSLFVSSSRLWLIRFWRVRAGVPGMSGIPRLPYLWILRLRAFQRYSFIPRSANFSRDFRTHDSPDFYVSAEDARVHMIILDVCTCTYTYITYTFMTHITARVRSRNITEKYLFDIALRYVRNKSL